MKVADSVIIYHLRTAWLEIEKVYNKVAASHNGTLSMGFALLVIEKGGTPVTHIAPRLGMEPNSMSRLLNSMEKKGLICRKKDEVDKRRVYVCLTEKGIKMRKLAVKMVFGLNEQISSDITADKLAIFFEVMQQIPASIEQFKDGMQDA